MKQVETNLLLQLCRRTVRKGSAFPAASEIDEAPPRLTPGGAASLRGTRLSERRSLSAVLRQAAALVLSILLAMGVWLKLRPLLLVLPGL